MAKIIRYEASRKPRRLGLLKGKIHLEKDWETWPDDIAASLGIEKE